MKKNILKAVGLVLLLGGVQSTIKGMEALSAAEKQEKAAELINPFITKAKRAIVNVLAPEQLISLSTLSKDNTFQVGELVIYSKKFALVVKEGKYKTLLSTFIEELGAENFVQVPNDQIRKLPAIVIIKEG